MPGDNRDIEARLARVESEVEIVKVKEQDDRERIVQLEKQTEAINNLATSVAVMASKQDTMNNELIDLKGSIKAVEDVPKKRYEQWIGYAASAVIAGLITFLLSLVL